MVRFAYELISVCIVFFAGFALVHIIYDGYDVNGCCLCVCVCVYTIQFERIAFIDVP